MLLLARREVLLALIATSLPGLAWGAEPALVDPLAAVRAKVSSPVAARLTALARAIELHRWEELLGYADPEHRSTQQGLFFSPGEEKPRNPADPAHQLQFREWYLQELLGLGMEHNHVDKLDDIVRIRYTGVEEPYDPGGPLQVTFEVEARGPRKLTGWFLLDPTSLLLSGAVG
jgi:hypothetical protein